MTMTYQLEDGTRFIGMVDGYTFKSNPAILDVMADGRFLCQVKMPCIPNVEYSFDTLREYVKANRPSLAEVDFEVLPSDKPVFRNR